MLISVPSSIASKCWFVFLKTAYKIDDKPSAVRYPRGTGYGLDKLRTLFGYDISEMPTRGQELEIGKGRIVRRPRATARQKAVILSVGTRLASALEAAIQLEVRGVGRGGQGTRCGMTFDLSFQAN